MFPAQRIAILSVAIEAASSRLDALLSDGVLTTNLLDGMAGRGKYVPGYVFEAARVATTTERFECLIFDHRPFFERVISEMRELDPALAVDKIESMMGLVSLPSKDSEEWTLQSRALHVRKVLDLAYGLLEEISREGLSDVPAEIARFHSVAVRIDERPICHQSRDEVLRAFAFVMSAHGLDREADLLESIVGWKPSTHGARLFTYAW
jgi:hypothetical protein